MRRVLQYFATRKKWWSDLAEYPPMIRDQAPRSVPPQPDAKILGGKRAYALRQANIQERIADNCKYEWRGLSEQLLSMGERDPTVMVEHSNLD